MTSGESATPLTAAAKCLGYDPQDNSAEFIEEEEGSEGAEENPEENPDENAAESQPGD